MHDDKATDAGASAPFPVGRAVNGTGVWPRTAKARTVGETSFRRGRDGGDTVATLSEDGHAKARAGRKGRLTLPTP